MSAEALARSRPLLVTDDPQLLDEVLNLAGRCGAVIEVAPDPAAARDRFGSASLVLVGSDLADACARARLPRRPGVIMVEMRADGGEPHWHLAERLGVEHIARLPSGASWLVDRLSMSVGPERAGAIVAVLGGRGGAGATVLACGLATTAVRLGRRVFLVDGDPFGGGLDIVFGWEHIDTLRWSGLADTAGALGVPALLDALPGVGTLALLSTDREDGPAVPVEAMLAALGAGRRGWDLTVVDLPRHFDDATVAALTEVDHAFLVVPAEIRACTAAARIASQALRHAGSMSLVVRQPGPGKLAAREISRVLGLPLAGTLRSEPTIPRGMEQRVVPGTSGQGSLATMCARMIDVMGLDEPGPARSRRRSGSRSAEEPGSRTAIEAEAGEVRPHRPGPRGAGPGEAASQGEARP